MCHSRGKMLNIMNCPCGSQFWLLIAPPKSLRMHCSFPRDRGCWPLLKSFQLLSFFQKALGSTQGTSQICKNNLLIGLGYSVGISFNLIVYNGITYSISQFRTLRLSLPEKKHHTLNKQIGWGSQRKKNLPRILLNSALRFLSRVFCVQSVRSETFNISFTCGQGRQDLKPYEML